MMNREDFKAVKHMGKAHLEQYLQQIYRRGFEAGIKAVASEMKKNTPGCGSEATVAHSDI